MVDAWWIDVQKVLDAPAVREANVAIVVPERRSRLLALFLQHFSCFPLCEVDRNAIVAAVCLVQMGLDVHDTVADQMNMYERHVRVLVGDLLSAHYYWLLATQEQDYIADARTILAQAICRVNEQKLIRFESVRYGNGTTMEQQQWQVDCDVLLYCAWVDWLFPQVRASYERVLRAMRVCEYREMCGDEEKRVLQQAIAQCAPEIQHELQTIFYEEMV